MTEQGNSEPTPNTAPNEPSPWMRALRARLEAMDKDNLVEHAIEQELRIAELRSCLESDLESCEHPAVDIVEEFTRNHLPADLLCAGRSYDALEPLTRIAGQPVTVGMLLQALRGDW